MAKREAGALFLPLNLDATSTVPLYRQLYEAVRHAILMGELAAGTRLPSTRSLAGMLGLSRTTVVVAFDQLLAEGYVEGQQGSGTFVSIVLPEGTDTNVNPLGETSSQVTSTRPQRRISQRGSLPRARTSATITPSIVGLRAFTPGLPDTDQFPFKTWARLVAQRWRKPARELLGYSNPAGYGPLRREIAAYVKAVRAVQCEPDQVIIVSGAQQGITLAAQVLLDPGDAAWIEDPCYLSSRRALLSAGAQVEPLPVDDEGLDVSAGIERCPQARLVYITPSYQFPMGVTMSLARRLRLLQWAAQTGAWILEDDYDCEYRYAGRPLSSLQGLDTQQQVIYIGTFSKALFPSLRLGYLVVPPDLVDAFVAARASADRQSAVLDQVVLTDFIHQGHFARHVRHMRQLYSERQATLVESVQQALAGMLEVTPAETGMHLPARLAMGVRDVDAFKLAAKYEVAAPPLSFYTLKAKLPDALLLGYTAVTPEEIQVGVQKLARAFT